MEIKLSLLYHRTQEIASHTFKRKEDPHGTKRKSSEDTAFKWMKSLSLKEIYEIQNACMKPITKLGYASFSSDITNHSEILVKSSDEVWPYYI